jgi:DNA-binding response OmpR family regulator
VLVAEDDKDMSAWVCAVLKSAGHETKAVFDTMSVQMAALREPQPEVVILDLGMPAGNGMGALARLQAGSKTRDIPVLVLSATRDVSAPLRALDGGAACFLAKPTTPEALLDAFGSLRAPVRATAARR